MTVSLAKGQEVIDHIEVCEDCTLARETGQFGGTPYEPWALLPTADIAADWDSETGEGIEDFTWSECPACGSFLGGSRHRYAVFSWDRTH